MANVNMNTGLQIIGVVILTVLSFFAGRFTAGLVNRDDHGNLSAIMAKMNPGDQLVIDEKDIQKDGDIVKIGGYKIEATNKEDYSRIMSMVGLSANEAAAKSQGLKFGADGELASSGVHQGYGVLEQLWTGIKNFFVGSFWFIFIGLGVLVILLFVPATSTIAATILRWLASLIPILGSFVEWIFSKFAFKKPLSQTVAGLDQAKADLRALPDPNTAITAAINALNSQTAPITGAQAVSILQQNLMTTLGNTHILTGSEIWTNIVAKDLGIAQDTNSKATVNTLGNR